MQQEKVQPVVVFDATGEATGGVMDWSIRAVEGGGVTLAAGGIS